MSLFLKQQSESESDYESETEYTTLTLTMYYYIEYKNKDVAKEKCKLRWNKELKQWYNTFVYQYNKSNDINVNNIFDAMMEFDELHKKYLSYPITKIVCAEIKADGIKKLEILLRMKHTKILESKHSLLILEIGMKKQKYELEYKEWYNKGEIWCKTKTDDDTEYKTLDNLPTYAKTLILINDNFNIMMQHLPPSIDTIYIKHSEHNNIVYNSAIRLPYGFKIKYFKTFDEIPELNRAVTYSICNVLM